MSPSERGRGRLKNIVVTVAVATVIVGSAALGTVIVETGSPPPPVGTANLWIDQNGGTCTRSSTPVSYSDASACTRDAAEAVWQWGDTVLIKGGTAYSGKWTIEYRAATDNGTCDPYGEWGTATTSQCVTIAPSPSESVIMDGAVEIHQGGLWINGTRSGTWPSLSPTYNWKVTGFIDVEGEAGITPDNTVINGIDASAVGTFSADNIMIRQSDAGGRVCNSLSTFIDPDTGLGINTFESKVGRTGGGADPVNIVWDGIYFHDVYRNAGGAAGDCHDGAFFFSSVNGFILRNSIFSQNWVYDIQIQNISGTIQGNIVIENNWFGCGVEGSNITTNPGGMTTCNGQAAIQLDSLPANNYLIRYNSFRDTAFSCFTGTDCTYSNTRFIGNAGGRPSTGGGSPCSGIAGVTFGYNAWDTGTCGATDVDAEDVSVMFANTAAGSDNYHLASGSGLANNIVATSTGDYAILTDIDGTSRPVGANRDAGSDEQ